MASPPTDHEVQQLLAAVSCLHPETALPPPREEDMLEDLSRLEATLEFSSGPSALDQPMVLLRANVQLELIAAGGRVRLSDLCCRALIVWAQMPFVKSGGLANGLQKSLGNLQAAGQLVDTDVVAYLDQLCHPLWGRMPTSFPYLHVHLGWLRPVLFLSEPVFPVPPGPFPFIPVARWQTIRSVVTRASRLVRSGSILVGNENSWFWCASSSEED